MIRRIIGVIAACISVVTLVSCDQKQQEQKTHQQESADYELQSIGTTTYLLEEQTGAVYALRSGEFVRIPRIELDAETGSDDIKSYDEKIPDLTEEIRLKHFDGKLYYQITISPQYTTEYTSYVLESLKRSAEQSKDKNSPTTQAPDPTPLIEPKQKYANPKWLSYWSVSGNALMVHLLDKDGFQVSVVTLIMGDSVYRTPRTQLVDNSGIPTGMDYEGSLEMTATDFQRIESTNTTYVLEKAK